MPGGRLADDRNELGRFLRARREETQPESVGLRGAGRRRVPGLRRDELAMLSGISSEYYVRLEQGRNQNPSTQVLEALARALRLDQEATAHLYRLSRPLPGPAPAPGGGVSPTLRGLLDMSPTTPAFVADRLHTVLAANALARRLSPAYRPGANLLRVLFLDPDVKGLYRDWDAEAEALVAALHVAARAGEDPMLSRLVADLSGESERFRTLWEYHDGRARFDGTTVFDHDAGTIELAFEKLGVLSAPGACPNSSGQYLTVFHAEPDSPSAHRLAALAAAETGSDTRGRVRKHSEHSVVVS
jgi:transcriptional regulator with XRE-family HTH domain